jgi:hypothetical protein
MRTNNAPRPLWRLLALASESEKPVELTCAECLALLEYDAELLEAGAPVDQIRPSIMRHLSLCSACQAYNVYTGPEKQEH